MSASWGNEEEIVRGAEPENNGDYGWCETCNAHVHLDYVKEDPDEKGEFLHRGHRM